MSSPHPLRPSNRDPRVLGCAVAVFIAVVCAGRMAAADPGVSLTGGDGFLLVPAARALPPGNFALGMQYAAGFGSSQVALGPGPFAVGAGLPPFFEATFSLRTFGLARDAVGSSGAARFELKAQPWTLENPATRDIVLAGGQFYVDHLADRDAFGGRLLASTTFARTMHLGASLGFHSGRAGAGAGPELGLAAAYERLPELSYVGEVLIEGVRPWAAFVGGSIQYRFLPIATVAVTLQWDVAGTAGVRLSAGLLFRSDRKWQREVSASPAVVAAPPRFQDEQPRFRLAIPVMSLPDGTVYRLLQPEAPPPPDPDDLESVLEPAAPRTGDGSASGGR